MARRHNFEGRVVVATGLGAAYARRFACAGAKLGLRCDVRDESAFVETGTAVCSRVMDADVFGSLHCTKAALPALLASRGLMIAGSKQAVHGFFSSLHSELAPRVVDILIVRPGFTATSIATAALDGDGSVTSHPQSTVGALATPESVAEAVFQAASVGRSLLVLSAAGKAAFLLSRLRPAFYDRLMARSLRKELSRSQASQ